MAARIILTALLVLPLVCLPLLDGPMPPLDWPIDPPRDSPFDLPAGGPVDPSLVGSWRVLSEAIFYDAGGGNWIDPVTQLLDLEGSGTWRFGSSSGTWWVAEVTSADWGTWDTEPYGPQRKIVLNGWDGGIADGPIEESDASIDSFWIIHPTDSSFGPAMVQMELGRW